MTEPGLRVDPLTGASVVVTPWRQHRPKLPQGPCPFCPGGLEAPAPYDVRCIQNRWPALPGGRHEVVLHSPDHHSSFLSLGASGTARVLEMWSARTAALGSRADVSYVFVFENQGRATGATIDHPHSQVMAFATIPPVAMAELANGYCDLCKDPGRPMTVIGHEAWVAHVPWAPSWPYEMLICPRGHISDLPSAGPVARAELAAILVECLARVDRVLGPGAPYMLWLHQRPSGPGEWPAAHLHLHLAPVLRAPGVVRHLASAELGAGVFFDPVDPREAAAQLRGAGGGDRHGG